MSEQKTVCAHCGIAGFVRTERVFIGDRAFLEHYCGRCEHTWTAAESDERRMTPRIIRKRNGQSDRSR